MHYGPNSAQVELFLARLKVLTPDEWEQIHQLGEPVRAAYGEADTDENELAVIHKYGHEPQWLRTAMLAAIDASGGGWNQAMAAPAIMALAICGAIRPAQFRAMYGPFAAVVPVESLGSGLAPKVAPPPVLRHERFLKRLEALKAAQWVQILEFAYALRDAFDGLRNLLGDWALMHTDNPLVDP